MADKIRELLSDPAAFDDSCYKWIRELDDNGNLLIDFKDFVKGAKTLAAHFQAREPTDDQLQAILAGLTTQQEGLLNDGEFKSAMRLALQLMAAPV